MSSQISFHLHYTYNFIIDKDRNRPYEPAVAKKKSYFDLPFPPLPITLIGFLICPMKQWNFFGVGKEHAPKPE